jgi:hypothetical protein
VHHSNDYWPWVGWGAAAIGAGLAYGAYNNYYFCDPYDPYYAYYCGYGAYGYAY